MKQKTVISTKPFINLIPKKLQEDCLTTRYYLPHFLENNKKMISFHSLKFLEDDCTEITDGLHYKPIYVHEEGILFISVKDISSGNLDFSNALYITLEEHIKNGRCAPQPNNILLSKVGTIGRAVKVPENAPEFNIYVSVALLKLKTDEDTDFITLFLNSDLAYIQMDRTLKGIGTPDLHLKDIKRIVIPEINHEEKRVIVHRYKSINKIVEEMRSKFRDKNSLKFRLLLEIDKVFLEELRLPKLAPESDCALYILPECEHKDRLDVSSNSPNFRKLYRSLVKSEAAFCSLKDVLEIENKRSNRITLESYIGLEHIETHTGRILSGISIELRDEVSAANTVSKSRLLYGRLRPYLNKILWIEEDMKVTGCSTEIWVCKVKPGVAGDTLAAFLRSNYGLRQLKYLPGGGTLPRVQEDQFLSILVPIIEEKDVNKIRTRLKDCIDRYDEQIAANRHCEALANSILSAAKANIFDLLNDEKYQRILAMADEVLETGTTPEVAA